MTDLTGTSVRAVRHGDTRCSLLLGVALLISTSALAQQASAPRAPAPLPPLAVPTPHYVTQVLEVAVKRPAAEAWSRVGRFCDLTEWLGAPCTLLSGSEGELGAVRSVGPMIEPIVAVTPLSYTYTMPERVGTPYNMQHNTLQAIPINANSSLIRYSFFWDNSRLSPAEQDKEIDSRKTRITRALDNIKQIVESGKSRPQN